ncbi:hypothetical protein [Streptomyces sp. NPDC050528]|uniref:hypothetical protein n=1 Tax=Streptomyces sp. NPDC050528 TaxID=3365623 RepID=UPI00378EFDC5
MHDDTETILDRGHHANAKTPWDKESWRTAALDWAHRELTTRGIRPTGRRGVRLRPWSVLVRIAVEDLGEGLGEGPGATTTVWLKAWNNSASRAPARRPSPKSSTTPTYTTASCSTDLLARKFAVHSPWWGGSV